MKLSELQQLPMDKASRFKRAKVMGFDTSTVWLHGTGETDEYGDPIGSMHGSDDKSDTGHLADLGTWFTESPEVADHFANRLGDYEYAQPQVYPVFLKMKNPVMFDSYEDLETEFVDFDGSAPEFSNYLKGLGYDGIVVEDSFTDVPVSRKDAVIFTPNQVRSIYAKFDETRAASGNISEVMEVLCFQYQ